MTDKHRVREDDDGIRWPQRSYRIDSSINKEEKFFLSSLSLPRDALKVSYPVVTKGKDFLEEESWAEMTLMTSTSALLMIMRWEREENKKRRTESFLSSDPFFLFGWKGEKREDM